jgi:hypothetical protein
LFWGFGLAQDPSSSLDLCTCVPVSVQGGSSRREEGGGEARRVSLGVLSRVSSIFFFGEKEDPRTLQTRLVHLCAGVAVSAQREEEAGGGKESKQGVGVVSLRGGGRDFGQRRTGGRSGAGLLRGVHAWCWYRCCLALPLLFPPVLVLGRCRR